MSKNIAAIYGMSTAPRYRDDPRVKYSDVGVGIEIEAEDYDWDRFPTDFSYWNVKEDGSLRNRGVEFCSKILFGQDIVDALEEIQEDLSAVDINWRAGIHVHVDVRSLSANELINVCALYSILEPIIFEWEGNGRADSNFCVPWFVNHTPLVSLGELLHSLQAKGDVDRRDFRGIESLGKYSALNLMPLRSQGSIEFRIMQSTADTNRILEFVNICMAIVREGSQLDTSPLYLVSEVGPTDFLRRTLGMGILADQVRNHNELIWRGIDAANILPALEHDIDLSGNVQSTENFPII